ncbi:MAG: hypothetical protein HON78_04245 [Legionellales bacterium]|nr:hypothetical protein [Legionellales bacterium]
MHSREKQKEHSTEAAIAASLVNDIITEISHRQIIDNENEKKYTLIEEEILKEISDHTIPEDLQREITRKPIKLALFSVRVINAIANSFMGVPAAAIIISVDQLLTGTAILTMTTPDKIFILALAIGILITFLILAYKTEAKSSSHKEISESVEMLLELSTIISISDDLYTHEKQEAKLEKIIIQIREGKLTDYRILTYFDENSSYQKVVNAEIRFNVNVKSPEEYKELYRAMHKLRTMIATGKDDSDIDNYINTIIDGHRKKYLYSYFQTYKDAKDDHKKRKEWCLLNKKLEINEEKYVVGTKYQKRLGSIGSYIGNVNAVVNGILTCTFGIGGLTAFLIIFFPGIQIPVIAAACVAVLLFAAGTVHSATITKEFMEHSFKSFGKIIDKETTLKPHKSYYEWFSFILGKASENKKNLILSLLATIAITALAAISVVIFAASAALPFTLPAAMVLTIVIIVAALTFIAAFSSYSSTFLQEAKEKETKELMKDVFFTEEDKAKYENAKTTKDKHARIAAAVFVICLGITIFALPLGLLTPIMISAAIAFSVFLLCAVFNNKDIINANNPHESSIKSIINYRLRLAVATVLGASFAITAGPAIAQLIIAALAVSSPVFGIVIAIILGGLVACSLYYLIPLVYWDISLKPAYTFVLPKKQDGVTPNTNQTHVKIGSAQVMTANTTTASVIQDGNDPVKKTDVNPGVSLKLKQGK